MCVLGFIHSRHFSNNIFNSCRVQAVFVFRNSYKLDDPSFTSVLEHKQHLGKFQFCTTLSSAHKSASNSTERTVIADCFRVNTEEVMLCGNSLSNSSEECGKQLHRNTHVILGVKGNQTNTDFEWIYMLRFLTLLALRVRSVKPWVDSSNSFVVSSLDDFIFIP